MRKIFIPLVAFLLIPCLTADPTLAAALSQQMFRTELAGNCRQSIFQEEALQAGLVQAFTMLRASIQVRKAEAGEIRNLPAGNIHVRFLFEKHDRPTELLNAYADEFRKADIIFIEGGDDKLQDQFIKLSLGEIDPIDIMDPTNWRPSQGAMAMARLFGMNSKPGPRDAEEIRVLENKYQLLGLIYNSHKIIVTEGDTRDLRAVFEPQMERETRSLRRALFEKDHRKAYQAYVAFCRALANLTADRDQRLTTALNQLITFLEEQLAGSHEMNILILRGRAHQGPYVALRQRLGDAVEAINWIQEPVLLWEHDIVFLALERAGLARKKKLKHIDVRHGLATWLLGHFMLAQEWERAARLGFRKKNLNQIAAGMSAADIRRMIATIGGNDRVFYEDTSLSALISNWLESYWESRRQTEAQNSGRASTRQSRSAA